MDAFGYHVEHRLKDARGGNRESIPLQLPRTETTGLDHGDSSESDVTSSDSGYVVLRRAVC